MAKLHFSAVGNDAVRKSFHDPEGVVEAMLQIIGHVQRGEPVPIPLDKYLVDALLAATSASPEKRGQALLHGLRLRVSNRRPAGDFMEIGGYVEMQMSFSKYDEDGNEIEPPLSQTKACKEAANRFGVSQSTALHHYRKHVEERQKSYLDENY